MTGCTPHGCQVPDAGRFTEPPPEPIEATPTRGRGAVRAPFMLTSSGPRQERQGCFW